MVNSRSAYPASPRLTNGAPGTVGVCGTASYAKPCVPLLGGISVTVGSAAALDTDTMPSEMNIAETATEALTALLINCQAPLLTAPPPCGSRVLSAPAGPDDTARELDRRATVALAHHFPTKK